MKAINTLIFVFLIISACKGSTESRSEKSNFNGDYPEEIVRLGLQKKYDISRWFMYCIHSNVIVPFRSELGINDQVTYGTLPLRLDDIQIRHDTVEIHFYFYYKDMKLDECSVEYLPYWGTVFEKNSDSIVLFSSRGDGSYYGFSCENAIICNVREVIPLQPDVLKYINEKRAVLDPWFRDEALRRGAIK